MQWFDVDQTKVFEIPTEILRVTSDLNDIALNIQYMYSRVKGVICHQSQLKIFEAITMSRPNGVPNGRQYSKWFSM